MSHAPIPNQPSTSQTTNKIKSQCWLLGLLYRTTKNPTTEPRGRFGSEAESWKLMGIPGGPGATDWSLWARQFLTKCLKKSTICWMVTWPYVAIFLLIWSNLRLLHLKNQTVGMRLLNPCVLHQETSTYKIETTWNNYKKMSSQPCPESAMLQAGA